MVKEGRKLYAKQNFKSLQEKTNTEKQKTAGQIKRSKKQLMKAQAIKKKLELVKSMKSKN